MKKTERFEMRLHPGTKARWESCADALGYPNVSLFVEDTIEATHFPDAAIPATLSVLPSAESPTLAGSGAEDGRAGDSVDEPENEVTPGDETRFPETGQTVPATPAHPDGGEPVAPAAPLGAVCSNYRNHRPKMWCKTCGKMMQ